MIEAELKKLGLAALILVAVFMASLYGFMAIITPPIERPLTQAPPPTQAPSPPPPEGRSSAPDFTLPIYGGGGNLTLYDLKGRPILLAFITPYCPYSQSEAPILSQLHRKYGDKMEFILISDQEEGLSEYIEAGNITFTVVVDEGWEVFAEYGIQVTPTILLIDGDMTVKAGFLGLAPLEVLEGVIESELAAMEG